MGECGGAGPPEKNHFLGARWALERKAMLMVREAGVLFALGVACGPSSALL